MGNGEVKVVEIVANPVFKKKKNGYILIRLCIPEIEAHRPAFLIISFPVYFFARSHAPPALLTLG